MNTTLKILFCLCVKDKVQQLHQYYKGESKYVCYASRKNYLADQYESLYKYSWRY